MTTEAQTAMVLKDAGKQFKGIDENLAIIFEQLAVAKVLGNLDVIADVVKKINLHKANANPFLNTSNPIMEVRMVQ